MTDKKVRKRNMLTKEPIIQVLRRGRSNTTNYELGTINGVKATLLAFGWTEDEANRVVKECDNEAQ